MLARAKEKQVYDALTQAELTEFLSHNCEAFDLIVSADALVYFGDLDGVVAAAAAALRPNGLLVFTLEHAAGPVDAAYRLEFHGRYSHGRAYVEQLLVRGGLRPAIVQADLRLEAGRPVAGLVVRATKHL
jgi:predicted TPR repeat methyltransferase